MSCKPVSNAKLVVPGGRQPTLTCPLVDDPTGEPRARGRCLCGSVDYEVFGELTDVIDCHCWRCRRWTGHHIAATGARADSVHFVDDAALRWFECGDGAAYASCDRCGASVGWRHSDRPGQISLCAGLLDPPTRLTTSTVIYASTASDYHRLDPTIETWPLEHD